MGDEMLPRVETLLLDPARLPVPLDDMQNEKKQSALHWACIHGALRCAAALIRSGANVEVRRLLAVPRAWLTLAAAQMADAMGCTPLILATQHGHTLLVHFLLVQAGANRDAVDAEGHTLLMWAIYRGKFKTVWYLLDTARVNVNAVDRKGARALHWCAMRRQAKVGARAYMQGCVWYMCVQIVLCVAV